MPLYQCNCHTPLQGPQDWIFHDGQVCSRTHTGQPSSLSCVSCSFLPTHAQSRDQWCHGRHIIQLATFCNYSESLMRVIHLHEYYRMILTEDASKFLNRNVSSLVIVQINWLYSIQLIQHQAFFFYLWQCNLSDQQNKAWPLKQTEDVWFLQFDTLCKPFPHIMPPGFSLVE